MLETTMNDDDDDDDDDDEKVKRSNEWYGSLVDPASSHMLVSKIKPCMSHYLDNCGNSRAETCKSELRPEMGGMLLLDQNQSVACGSSVRPLFALGSIPEKEPEKQLPHARNAAAAHITHSRYAEIGSIGEKVWYQQPRVGSPLAMLNWHYVIHPTDGLSSFEGDPTDIPSQCSSLSVELEVRRRSDTVLVLTINDANQRSADVSPMTLQAASGKPKFLGFAGNMVAKLKLKGINGRAPSGVKLTT
ncbi:uncharacterized protein LOC143431363 [Xylocopa sonorina]|uniref:uncharacterized protein LOC143431363 n=1 Tax=Xylocopa sonorina TaxID=1818115 RepID=UPI00403B05BC